MQRTINGFLPNGTRINGVSQIVQLATPSFNPLDGSPLAIGDTWKKAGQGLAEWNGTQWAIVSPVQQLVVSSMAQNATQTVTGTVILDVADKVVGSISSVSPHNMTANNLPSPYVVSATSINSATFDAYLAFNGIISQTSAWIAAPSLPQTLKIDLGSVINADGFRIAAGNYNPNVLTFTVEGSNNNSTWTVLSTVTSSISATAYSQFNFSSTQSYRYWRVVITAAISNTAAIGEFDLFVNGSSFANPSLILGTDYSVTGSALTGSQTLTVKRLKSTTADTIITYI